MDMRIPPLTINTMLESNPLKSRILVRRWAVVPPPKLKPLRDQPSAELPGRCGSYALLFSPRHTSSAPGAHGASHRRTTNCMNEEEEEEQ